MCDFDSNLNLKGQKEFFFLGLWNGINTRFKRDVGIELNELNQRHLTWVKCMVKLIKLHMIWFRLTLNLVKAPIQYYLKLTFFLICLL